MVRDDDSDYYTARSARARELAACAQSIEARHIHLDMADRYAQLADRAARERPLLLVVNGGR